MKLYYSPGTSSLLLHIVLVEAGLPFDTVKTDDHTKAMDGVGDYRDVNPLGYVPALQLDDGTVLKECAAIVQYVADAAPAKNLAPPNGTLERTKLQSWLSFLSTEVHMGGFCPLYHPEVPDAVQSVFRRRLATRLAHVEAHLTRNDHLLGQTFPVADVYVFVMSNWARSTKVDLSSYPRLLGLRRRVGARPPVQAAMKVEGLTR